VFHRTRGYTDGSLAAPFSHAADWKPTLATMPGGHKHEERHSLKSRNQMLRSLLKVVDGRRDQGTKQFIEPHKLALIDQLTQAPDAAILLRDYPKSKPVPSVRQSSRRAASALSGMSTPMSRQGAGVRLTPLPSQTHPQQGKPARSAAFYDKMNKVDHRFLAKMHKNMQEKVYSKFKNTREAFRRFDLNHSGAIDFGEFRTVMRDLELINANTDPAQVDALFHLCDESGHGEIGYLDFCKWIKAPDRHENLMVRRETPYSGQRGGMSFGQRSNWIRALGVMCE